MKSTSLFEIYQQDLNVDDMSQYQKHNYIGHDSLEHNDHELLLLIFRYFLNRTPKHAIAVCWV